MLDASSRAAEPREPAGPTQLRVGGLAVRPLPRCPQPGGLVRGGFAPDGWPGTPAFHHGPDRRLGATPACARIHILSWVGLPAHATQTDGQAARRKTRRTTEDREGST